MRTGVRRLLMGVSGAALLLALAPSFLVFAGLVAWETHATLVLIGTVVWFATAGWWMRG